MWYYDNFSIHAWVYLAMHGSYGLLWIFKDIMFSDKGFRIKIDLVVTLALTFVLMLYWVIGWVVISKTGTEPSGERMAFCISCYIIGVSLMLLTDLQKHIILSFRKGLIDKLLVERNRNTNYLGEMLLYFAFAFYSGHIISYSILLIIWSTIFVSRIYEKEQSLKKKDGYENYSKRSYLIIFKVFDSDLLNFIYYSLFSFIVYFLYSNGLESILKTLF
jgi:protein-S-isoprenylcysteine O-methyltransferase Ste14